uniref:Uncharacterized protein n=1 Tax=Octactis speculum TaxID=3111310 RepID=A0A7S2G2X2_9STRA
MEEYKLFHRRLLRIVEEDGNMELTDEEALAMMEDDFKADSAADGSVDKEEFRWSVFQLADQWTTSVDVEEYVAFLEKGFEIVFSDLIAADKLVLPSCWKKALKQTKTITALPEARVVDMLSGILHDKIKADQSDLKKGTKLDHLADYSVEWFNTQYGSGAAMKKQFKSFVTGLLKMVDDDKSVYNDYGLLFCQMAGIGTPSGRIKALPPDASQTLQLHLDDIQALCSVGKGSLLEDAKKMTHRQSSIKRDDKKSPLPRRGSSKSTINRTVSNGSSKALVRGGANSRTTYLVSGFIETSKAERYLNKVLSDDLGCDSTDPLCRVTALSLQVLSTKTANVKGGTVRSVQCMSFTVLMGIIFAAWGTRNVDKQASK